MADDYSTLEYLTIFKENFKKEGLGSALLSDGLSTIARLDRFGGHFADAFSPSRPMLDDPFTPSRYYSARMPYDTSDRDTTHGSW